MSINISGHHVEVTEAMEAYVKEKLVRLERHVDPITSGQITLTLEKGRQQAEATLHASGADFHATSTHDDMYAAIDLLADKLDRQLLKHKEKLIARQHGQG
ncbi:MULTISPECIES: ribosome hibernation-promoting factor, HPF/YfiA family [unclassified Oceanobacter]|jgi:putative sigma-54 modulation protein|uniref:ribosome hibernation-promoting factor, HPF/YfiA family n=1 Tax=unclassified Oceanobacter TaxID=2620260 RepID=UPI0026E2118B|nr:MULTISPECIES: ribosome-associated translation inhibitor RaiA [unclassified Oceanobacter]MDO6681987.1 ribosome-associated translation inhibitor RaiA [Oceanobacter sp. 5_MG-2023]MDP2505349.1 ribosome-associated translation inhibitor RaiA [Oceanobacter sp. 3_MG-2023]MDP2548023.1 ribosome-associated translation inhibitor RaiA [Oceanobacter sp. 4_MG-2023]MDP2610123.1 ribosome-associated translation inhibitor RaiA [Oceanobacter sp. 1_MG-2023]MDP2612302.1 ribosome-associated translation inhibitor 